MTTRRRTLPVTMLVVATCAPLLALVTTAQPARAQEGCLPAAPTSWGAPATRGEVPEEGAACRTVDVASGDVVRVQAASSAHERGLRVALVDDEGSELCGEVSPAAMRCEVTGPSPHHLLISRSAQHPGGEAEFHAFVTVVDSPGCETSRLGRFGAELPVIGSTTGAQPGCFAFTAGDQPDHLFSSWAAGRPFGWTPSWELWRADGADPEFPSGVPVVSLHHTLEPGASYRLVRDAAPPGWTEEVEYRAGFIDSFSDEGCPTLPDIAIGSPALDVETERGSVGCRRLPAPEGTLVVNEGPTDLAAVLGRGTSPCASHTCTLGEDPRVVSRSAGPYTVSDVDDTRRCAPWGRDLDDVDAPPVSALLQPGRQCWTVETRGVPLYGHVVSQWSEGSTPQPGYGELWTRDAERCRVTNGAREQGVDCDDAHVFVVEGREPGERMTARLRHFEGEGSDNCATLTPASVARVDGLLDEVCFTVELPQGFLFAVDQSLSNPSPAHGEHTLLTSVFGPDGLQVCGAGNPYQCRTTVAGRYTVSMVHASLGSVEVAPRIRALSPRYAELPVVGGDATVGGELRLDGGRTEPADLTLTDVTWLRDGRVVGRGPTYSPTVADLGRVVRPRVELSVHTWDPAVYDLPGRIVGRGVLGYRGRLVIRGVSRPGALLRAPVRARAVSDRGVRVRYRWLRDGRKIPGARAARYRVGPADRGHALRLRAVLRKPGHRALTLRTPARRVPRG